MGTLLRYPHEVRDAQEYFDEIQDVKATRDMLDLARHIVEQKSGSFEPDKFEDQYETALVDLINQKRAGKPIAPKERPRGENVVDLWRRCAGASAAPWPRPRQRSRRPRRSRPRSRARRRPAERDVDADYRQGAGEGGRCQEACRQATTEVRLTPA